MFFPFRSTSRKHWQPRGSHRARAVTWTERLCVRDSKCPDVHVCVKIARALELEHALLLSSIRREPRPHTDVWRHRLSLVCGDHRVATMHFLGCGYTMRDSRFVICDSRFVAIHENSLFNRMDPSHSWFVVVVRKFVMFQSCAQVFSTISCAS